MDGLHGPPCAQCRPPRCLSTRPVSLQAATIRLQRTRQGSPLLLSRLPQEVFVLVAGGDVKVLISITFSSFPTVNGRFPGVRTDATVPTLPVRRVYLSIS